MITIYVAPHGTSCKVERDGELMAHAIAATIKLRADSYTEVEIERYVLDEDLLSLGKASIDAVKLDIYHKPRIEKVTFSEPGESILVFDVVDGDPDEGLDS